MTRKRSQAATAKTGRTWSPTTGLTITERGPFQFQARIRRTGRAGPRRSPRPKLGESESSTASIATPSSTGGRSPEPPSPKS